MQDDFKTLRVAVRLGPIEASERIASKPKCVLALMREPVPRRIPDGFLRVDRVSPVVLAAAGEGAILAGPVGTTPPMVSGGDWTPAGMELVSRENDVH